MLSRDKPFAYQCIGQPFDEDTEYFCMLSLDVAKATLVLKQFNRTVRKEEIRVSALLLSASMLLFTNEIRQATGLLEIEIISEYQLYVDKSIVVHHVLPASQEIFPRQE